MKELLALKAECMAQRIATHRKRASKQEVLRGEETEA